MVTIGRTLGGVLGICALVTGSGQALGEDDKVLEERLADCARRNDGECFLQLAAFEEAAEAFEKASRQETSASGVSGAVVLDVASQAVSGLLVGARATRGRGPRAVRVGDGEFKTRSG